jgi:hypothetical protein
MIASGSPTPAGGWIEFYRTEIEPRLSADLVYGNERLEWRRGEGRGPCPLHGGDNPTAFVVLEDTLRWRCWTRCEPGYGDALDFVRLKLGLDVVEAVTWIRGRVGDRLRSPAPPPHERSRPAKPRLPPGEAERLWTACSGITQDAIATAWLWERFHGRVDPGRVEDLDLARALPYSVELPWWASGWRDCDRRTLADRAQHRLIVPMFDAAGVMTSLRARSLRRDQPNPKEKAPRGYRADGLVMADVLGRRLLAGHRDAAELVADAGIWIVEGVTDFIAQTTRWGESDIAPAVFGIVSGSWSAELASCVPDGTEIIVATDADAVGEKYARQVIATLRSRSVRLRRWTP